MKTIFFSALFVVLCAYMYALNTFEVKVVPQKLVNQYYKASIQVNLPRETYKVSKKEINKQKDVTNYLQNILNTYQSVLLPNTRIEISKQGLKIPSNRNIFFDRNTLIVFTGIANGRLNDIIKIYDATNVKIYNARIEGSRNMPGQSGEWSAGIAILNSSNVYVENAHIYDTWGDGLFVGSESNGVSKDITIKNVWIDKARRNAISVTSAINLSISNVLLSNTNGTLPECGVDVEPSLFGEYLQNVNFNNLYSYNNKNAAFNINLNQLCSNTKQYSDSVIIELKDFYDQFSRGFVGLNLNNFKQKYTPSGTIKIFNGVSYSEKHNVELQKQQLLSNVKLISGNLKKESPEK